MPHRSSTSVKSLVVILSALMILAAKTQAAPALPEKKSSTDTVILAKSSAADPAARQIVRTVANESLKTISTKDSTSHDESTVTPLEDHGPVVLPSKVQVESAPGTRAPAAAKAAADTKADTKHVHDHDDAKADAHDDAKAEAHDHSVKTEDHNDAHVTKAPASEKPAAPAKVEKPTAKEEPKAPAAHAATVESVPAEKALSWLQNGNKRYLKKANRSDGKSQADRDRLVKGQHPHTIVLSCSDSRVPPETVFDQSLGEIFVIRTAGEAIDSSVLASIEYAVEHLGPKLIVVMGHTSCGAVKATISTKEGDSAGSPSLDALIADIRPRLPARGPAGVSSQNLEIESSSNAQGVAADLIKRSEIIRNRVEKGDLKITPALYYLDSGAVKFY